MERKLQGLVTCDLHCQVNLVQKTFLQEGLPFGLAHTGFGILTVLIILVHLVQVKNKKSFFYLEMEYGIEYDIEVWWAFSYQITLNIVCCWYKFISLHQRTCKCLRSGWAEGIFQSSDCVRFLFPYLLIFGVICWFSSEPQAIFQENIPSINKMRPESPSFHSVFKPYVPSS